MLVIICCCCWFVAVAAAAVVVGGGDAGGDSVVFSFCRFKSSIQMSKRGSNTYIIYTKLEDDYEISFIQVLQSPDYDTGSQCL